MRALANRLGEQARPVVTAALVGGVTGAALAGLALLGTRLWKARRKRPVVKDPPSPRT